MQANADDDGQGDACDTDADNDGVSNEDDAFPNDDTETADSDGDGTGDNGDNCPIISNALQSNIDADEEGDACDDDIDGDGVSNEADAFPEDPIETADSDGDGVGDNADAFPNDPDETVDTDGDGTGDVGDNCPAIANADQTDADNNGLGDACDAGDTDGDGVFSDDNCPLIANADQADADNDGVGDLCDNCPMDANPDQADADTNGTGNVCEAIITARPIHFDFFYNQLSSETGAFKAAVVGETVTQSDGTIEVGVGVDSTDLDLGEESNGLSEGSFNVRADYAATEHSQSYSGIDFSVVESTSTDARISGDDLTFDASLFDGVLSIPGETSLSAWGDNNFIAAGRVMLNGVSTTFTVVEEQALSLLSYAESDTNEVNDDGNLNTEYGVVILDTDYGDNFETSVEELVNLFSAVSVHDFDGDGAVTISNGSGYESGLGLSGGSVDFSTELPASEGTYTISTSGAVEIVTNSESQYGFTDGDGDLFTLGDPNSRTYGVKLGTGYSNASLANAEFDLKGLVIESCNERLGASTYEGLTATFNADGTTLTLSATDIPQAFAQFSDTALPSVTTLPKTLDLTSDAITVAGNGRLSPITFADSGLELEGFIAENGGLLLRIVEMEMKVVAGLPAGLQVGEDFYPVTGPVFNNLTPSNVDGVVTVLTPGGQFLAGVWVEASGSETISYITSDVRNGSSPDFATVTEGSTVTITQGVLFGIPVTD